MKRFSWSIAKYTLQSILPYFIFSWLLLSVILFFQQAARYSDIFFNTILPKNLVWQLSFALIPNVIAFTGPMAILVGVVIGLSKMQGDSELRAIRAAGIGNFQIVLPAAFLGFILCLFTFYVNIGGVPFAAKIVRQVALQTALLKLESPIEPGVFNTEISGYTIYVRDVDFEKGTWKNIFITTEDKTTKQTRLITSKSGRIDTKAEESELVLDNALVTTLSTENAQGKYISESVKQLRIGIQTKRGEIIEKLSKTDETPDELGLWQLARLAGNLEGKEKIEAQILFQRRVILSTVPLLFSLLGAGLVLRFNRGGKGFGIFISLVCLISYYLITLLFEQLARTNQINVLTAGYSPVLLCLLVIVWLLSSNRRLNKKISFRPSDFLERFRARKEAKQSSKNVFFELNRGILDLDIILSLLRYYAITIGFLASIYLIFTAFELWKFAGTIENGTQLLFEYLFYLSPFIYVQLAPSAVMIAILATYIIKSRQNEIITWTAAGRSIYRLILPCLGLMSLIGVLNFGLQETVLPSSNFMQDKLRTQIRSRGILANKEGKYWLARNQRIYSFEAGNQDISNNEVNKITIYEFTEDNSRLLNIYRGENARWENGAIKFRGATEKLALSGGLINPETLPDNQLADDYNLFGNLQNKPSHLNIWQTREKILNSESELETRNFQLALEKKYLTLILPVVITIFTAPFALSLSHKNKVTTVGYGVGSWLLFLGVSNFFDQYGLNGSISPQLAAWSPLIIFTFIGIILLSKIKT